MQQVEHHHEYEILSEAELQLLRAIRDYIDSGKGYFPAIGRWTVLRDTEPDEINRCLAKLYEQNLISPAPGLGFNAYDVTAAGRRFLIERGFTEQPNWTIREFAQWLFDEKLSPILVRLLGLDHLAE